MSGSEFCRVEFEPMIIQGNKEEAYQKIEEKFNNGEFPRISFVEPSEMPPLKLNDVFIEDSHGIK